MYNTQKGPTKQNRVIRTPNIIKLTESGVLCIAYSCFYEISCRTDSLWITVGSQLLSLHRNIFQRTFRNKWTVSVSMLSIFILLFSYALSLSLLFVCILAHMCNGKACTFSFIGALIFFFPLEYCSQASTPATAYTHENPELDGKIVHFHLQIRALTCISL